MMVGVCALTWMDWLFTLTRGAPLLDFLECHTLKGGRSKIRLLWVRHCRFMETRDCNI
jgi:hypothetical protein